MFGKKYFVVAAFLIIILTLSYFYYYAQRPSHSVQWGNIVKTNSGSIRGIISRSRDGREFHQWLKIPYAQPPVGPLRFNTPRPVKRWDDVRDGSSYGSKCAQLQLWTAAFSGSEDCLFLNIHVPKLPHNRLLPVLVFVHGGSFVSGSGSEVDPVYVMDEDVVFITINYRVGVLGFLTTGDKNIRGNMGLKDQVEALRWIKRNVEFFGGNSNQITVIGNSAGAAAVHYLTLSPSTQGLFNKAISMGGTAILPWSFSPLSKAVERTRNLGRKLKCSLEDNVKLTDCLRNFEVKELLSVFGSDMTELSLFSPTKVGQPIIPTVEAVDDAEAFLTLSPYDAIIMGKAHKVPWMAGVVRDEGLLSTFEFYRNSSALDYMEKNWDQCIQNSFSFIPGFTQSKALDASKKIRDFYFPPRTPDLTNEEKISRLTQIYSDGHFLAGTTEVGAAQRRYSPVYLYYYNKTGTPSYSRLLTHTPSSSNVILESVISPLKSFWNNYILRRKPREYGINHAEDGSMLYPIFSFMAIPKDENNDLYKFSKDFTNLIAQFAKDETSMEFRGTKFRPTGRSGALMYLKLDDDPKMIFEPFARRSAFWHSLGYVQLFSSPKSR